MATTTSTTLDDLFPTIIAEARYTAEQQSLMLGLVKSYNIGSDAGKVIQIPKYPSITAAALTEGTDMSSTTVSTSSVSITVAEVGVQVVLSDVARDGAGDPGTAMGVLLGSAVARKMDQDLLALFDGFSTSIGGAGTEITVADIFKAVAVLQTANAPGAMAAVIHPKVAFALKSNLTNAFANPHGGVAQNEAMVRGFVGSLAGVDIYQSSNLAVDGNGDAKGAVFSPEALAIALKRDFQIETQRDASLRADELNATAVYGVGELDDSYGVELFFDATV